MLTAWCAGIMAAVLLNPLIPWLLFATVSTAVLVLVNRRLALLAGLCLVAALTGAARGATVATVELPPGLAGQAIAVSGAVDDDPVDRRGARRLTVRVDHVLTRAGEIASGLRIEVAVYGATPVRYGDLVLLSGELQAPPRFDQFDYRAYLGEQGIAGVMPSAKLVRITSHPGDPLHTMLFGLRHAVIAAIDRALPEPQAALLLGVVFGYRTALPRQLEQQMIASGLIHIVVISGQITSKLIRTGIWAIRARLSFHEPERQDGGRKEGKQTPLRAPSACNHPLYMEAHPGAPTTRPPGSPKRPSNRALLEQVAEAREHLTAEQWIAIKEEVAKRRPLRDTLAWWRDKCAQKVNRAVVMAAGLVGAAILSVGSGVAVPQATAAIEHSGTVAMAQFHAPAGTVETGEAGGFVVLTGGLGGLAWRRRRSANQWETADDAGRDCIYALVDLNERYQS